MARPRGDFDRMKECVFQAILVLAKPTCFASTERLANAVGRSVRHTYRYLAKLREEGRIDYAEGCKPKRFLKDQRWKTTRAFVVKVLKALVPPPAKAKWGIPRYDIEDLNELAKQPVATTVAPSPYVEALRARLAPALEMAERAKEARRVELERVENDPEYATHYWHRLHDMASRCYKRLSNSPAVEAMLRQYLPEST